MEPSSSKAKPKRNLFKPKSESAQMVVNKLPKSMKLAIKEVQDSDASDEHKKYFVKRYTEIGQLHNFIKYCNERHEFNTTTPAKAQDAMLKKIEDANKRIEEIYEELNNHIEVSEDEEDVSEEDLWENITITEAKIPELNRLIEEFVNDPVNRKKNSCGLTGNAMLGLFEKLPEHIKVKYPEGDARYEAAAETLLNVKPNLRQAMMDKVTQHYLQNERTKVNQADPLGEIVVDPIKRREIKLKINEMIKDHRAKEDSGSGTDNDVIEIGSSDSEHDDDEVDSDLEIISNENSSELATDGGNVEDEDEVEEDDSDIEFVEEVINSTVRKAEEEGDSEAQPEDSDRTKSNIDFEDDTEEADDTRSETEASAEQNGKSEESITGEQMEIDPKTGTAEDQLEAAANGKSVEEEGDHVDNDAAEPQNLDQDVSEAEESENIPEEPPASSGSSASYEPAAKRAREDEDSNDVIPAVP